MILKPDNNNENDYNQTAHSLDTFMPLKALPQQLKASII